MRVLVTFLLLFPVILLADVEVRNGKISADFYSQTLRQVVQKMESETKIHFSLDEVVADKTVSANFQDLPVGLAIKKMLEGTGINYAVIATEEGGVRAVFIGGSERPGAAPRRLDTRPAAGRGVVIPVEPMHVAPRAPAPEQKRIPPLRRGADTTVDVPTGGGYVPPSGASEPSEMEQQEFEQEPPEEPEEEE